MYQEVYKKTDGVSKAMGYELVDFLHKKSRMLSVGNITPALSYILTTDNILLS